MEVAYSDALTNCSHRICPVETIIPPNRLETRNRDLIRAMGHCWGARALDTLRDRLREMTGRSHVFFAPSARCAFAQLLSILPHKEVVLPAFTCSVVRRAAELAGKRLIYVDIAPRSVNSEAEQYIPAASPGRILVPTHLFGIPADIEAICEVARDRHCVTIEDAAGGFPATYKGRMLGTFADVGIISFERSKRIPAFHGAAIIVNNENAIDPAKLEHHRIVPTRTSFPVRECLFSFLYNLATKPWIYGRVALPRILQKYGGESSRKAEQRRDDAIADNFYNREFHPYQAALVNSMLRRVEEIRQQIRTLVEIYRVALGDTSVCTFVPPMCDTAGLLRFPVGFPGRERREVLLAALRCGLFLETNFERPVPDEGDYAGFPNAIWAAKNLVLLPLYTGLSVASAQKVVSAVVQIDRQLSEQ
jgi:dTDP-4-amino-4,6-dideoxygalactose transaminase